MGAVPRSCECAWFWGGVPFGPGGYPDRMQVGPYTVVEEVARGGMGVVYRARGPRGNAVALKLLHAQRATDARARTRFQLEVEALARLRHLNVVKILGAGEHAGRPWLALEFVEGTTLESRIEAGPLPVWEALRIVQQLARALDYVHGCGLLHRDLKPANVLLRGDQALLTDFGLVLDDAAEASRLTATGVFHGTPGYWAPEQARGDLASLGPGTDVYGLGAVLYACLTGRPPVQAESLVDFMRTVEFARTRPPRALRREVPAWLSELCMRCLAVDPAARPASAAEVARALTLAEAGAQVPSSRRRAGVAVGLLAGFALVLGVVWWAVWQDVAEPTRTDPLLNQAFEELKVGRVEASLALSARVLELDPENPGGYFGRGYAKESQGHVVEALADYDRALELGIVEFLVRKGNSPSVFLVSRGFCLAELGRHEEALEAFDLALGHDPAHEVALYNRANSLQMLGRDEAAFATYSQVLEATPDDPQTLFNRANCLVKLGRHVEAVRDYDRALELGLDPVRAGVAQRRRKVAAARTAVRDAGE